MKTNDPPRMFPPMRPYDVVAAINRIAIATGSPRYAAAASNADYNGHSVSVSWNEYRGYWIAEYFWAGRNVLARGEYADCVRAAMREYDRGALGASVFAETRELSQAVLAESMGMRVWSKEAEEDELAKWYTWKHREAGHALRNGTERLLLDAPDKESYEASLKRPRRR